MTIPQQHTPPFRVSMAPMMDYTDRHDRFFMRQISRHALLYTEMLTTGAVIHGNRDHLLGFDPSEQPVALQLGGSDPRELAECARICQDWGYSEINLNVGCPSDRVQSGRFGACLMATPKVVAECVSAMSEVVSVPVTVKTRIGIDERDSYEDLCEFIETVSKAGTRHFIMHARKCILKGLSPKQNREIPPLRYEFVYSLKRDYPHLEFVLNGGVKTLDEVQSHLENGVDGVMIGRAAYDNPCLFCQVDNRFYGSDQPVKTRTEIVRSMKNYTEDFLRQGIPLGRIARHMLNLYKGQARGKVWRRYLTEHMHKPGADWSVLEDALELVNR